MHTGDEDSVSVDTEEEDSVEVEDRARWRMIEDRA